MRYLLAWILPIAVVAQAPRMPPRTLPPAATSLLSQSLDVARQHRVHVWRDRPPLDADGTVNGYVEIPRGERNKFEFDMKANRRIINRVMPESVGGYPVNYGFVPQTVSYDGDPFDVLVLGPALPGGEIARGKIVGVMLMEDDKGLDSKVVISTLDAQGLPRFALTAAEQSRIGDFFNRYKKHEPGKFSKVTGWGTAAEGLAYVQTTHAFFRECAKTIGSCVLKRPAW